MARLFWMIFLLLAATTAAGAASDTRQATELARRLSPRLAQKVKFTRIDAPGPGTDLFTLESRGDKVVIGGNNAGAMAVGLNHYLNRYCMTTVSWYADVPVELPRVLPSVPRRERVMSRVPQRFFLNYCTYGYTMPFWDWHDWERFIDWMALQGVNMPLAITGQESVWLKVWTRLGMTPDEVRAFFTGPAYLPWHRMANIDAWCGPLPQEWLDHQAALQQQIVQRERELAMRPVLPAFAGHVPGRLRELFPQANIQALSAWAGFDERCRTFFLDSEDPLYATIQRMFLEEQTRMYGTDHLYGVDPFNEVDPPSFDPDYLHRVARHIYESLTAVDPRAEWVQMAWFLYYQRNDYTPARTRAMLTGVPQGKMTMLDYYCEYKEMWRDLDGFYGQPFIWCYLGNFGGNSNIQGNVLEAGNRLEEALRHAGGNLVGIGSTLEGLDVQQFPYEYILEKAWNHNKTDAQAINELADRHAGRVSPHARRAWTTLCDSVMRMHPANFSCPLPCSYPQVGKETAHCAVRYNPRHLMAAWDDLLAQDSVTTTAMTVDLVWVGRQLLGDLFLSEKRAFDSIAAAPLATTLKMQLLRQAAAHLDDIIADMDTLNAGHPFATLHKWVGQARALSSREELRAYYEMNARRLITTWGGNLNDYACRNWAGLLSDYYRPRWDIYFQAVMAAAQAGGAVDEAAMRARIAALQDEWPLRTALPPLAPPHDVLAFSRHLRHKWFPAQRQP